MNWTVHGHKCLSSFLFFRFFKLREREGVYKIWYTEKQTQSYLSYFSTGFHWRIFLLSRANRLYAIFNTGLKNLGPSCPRYVFVFFTRSNGYGSVCHEPLPITNFFLFYFRWREGVPTSVLGSQPIVWLLPSYPPGQAILLGLLDVTQVRLLLIQTRG